jgi:hypothetical protein
MSHTADTLLLELAMSCVDEAHGDVHRAKIELSQAINGATDADLLRAFAKPYYTNCLDSAIQSALKVHRKAGKYQPASQAEASATSPSLDSEAVQAQITLADYIDRRVWCAWRLEKDGDRLTKRPYRSSIGYAIDKAVKIASTDGWFDAGAGAGSGGIGIFLGVAAGATGSVSAAWIWTSALSMANSPNGPSFASTG